MRYYGKNRWKLVLALLLGVSTVYVLVVQLEKLRMRVRVSTSASILTLTTPTTITTTARPPTPKSKPKPTPPTSDPAEEKRHTHFFKRLNRTTSHNIEVDAQRGFWSGSDTALYHRARFGADEATRLSKFFQSVQARTVIDLGGGAGDHARAIMARIPDLLISCYDGNPDSQLVSNGTCATLDLTRPVHVAPHEWVMSLSVGRQIPPEYEDAFIENVHNSNTKGIVMYWGDGKPVSTTKHKSVRSALDVVRAFSRLGYTYDRLGSELIMNGRNGRAAVDAHRGFSTVVLHKSGHKPAGHNEIRIAVVCCSEAKLVETLTMIKAAILFSQHVPRLMVYVFSDEGTRPELANRLQNLSKESATAGLYHFDYELHLTSWPPEIPGSTIIPWAKVFKPCSLQRLFLPDLLPNVDSLLYLDADTLPLANLTDLWSYFDEMNKNPATFTALAPIVEPRVGESWFTKNHIPHYGPTGLNCGLALMNLTRMREYDFVRKIVAIRIETEASRPTESGDQFLQNVFYSRHPEHVLLLPCHWNLRRVHCHCGGIAENNSCACESALRNGVGLIHGTRSAFSTPERLPLFMSIHRVFERNSLLKWSTASPSSKWHRSAAGGYGYWHSRLVELQDSFDAVENKCFGDSSDTFYKRLTNYFINLKIGV